MGIDVDVTILDLYDDIVKNNVVTKILVTVIDYHRKKRETFTYLLLYNSLVEKGIVFLDDGENNIDLYCNEINRKKIIVVVH